MISETIEDYVKAIFGLEKTHETVSTTVLAERLDVSPASVTGMIKKMAEMNLLEYERYQGVRLTESGRKIALEVIRHHRLVELYLSEALGVPWDRVHDEAEKWEHVLSEYLEDRIDAVLGYPTTDPHGSLIPDRNGDMKRRELTFLADLEVGQHGTVAEVSDHDPELLRYLADLTLYPEEEVEVLSVAPFNGPLVIRVNGEEQTIGREAAGHVFMSRVTTI